MTSAYKAREVIEHTAPLRVIVLAISNLDLRGIVNPHIETLHACQYC
jgi:hypothetical protein